LGKKKRKLYSIIEERRAPGKYGKRGEVELVQGLKKEDGLLDEESSQNLITLMRSLKIRM